MKGRTGYFMIALLLTLLNAVATVYYGVAIWRAWQGDIWGARNLGFPCRIRGHIGRQCLGSGRPWIKRFAFWSDD
jgi:hypothetical protein